VLEQAGNANDEGVDFTSGSSALFLYSGFLMTGFACRRMVWLGTFLALTTGNSCAPAADVPKGPPATVAQAAAVLDLSQFPLLNEAEEVRQRHVAGLFYNSQSSVPEAFDFQRKQLLERKFVELPATSVSDQTASGGFAREGFRVSVTVFPAGKPGESSVTITNHGNVQLDTLPVPADARPLFVGPAMAMFVTEASPADAVAACGKLLAEKGWQPYGSAGDNHFFKQNAIRLSAHISSAPAQGGKTMIQYASELMSADLPPPLDATRLQYADVTKELSFDTRAPLADVAKFYRTELAKSGWQATTENPIKIGFRQELIFRNQGMDLLDLKLQEEDHGTRGTLKFQTAAEVEEIEKRIKEKLDKKKAEQE